MKETVTSPKSKDEAARELAESHFRVEPYMLHIFRLLHKDRGREQYPEEPIKLLEVNPETITAGIQPIRFGPHASSGMLFSSIIVEITPDEYTDLLDGRLTLPNDWEIGPSYPHPNGN